MFTAAQYLYEFPEIDAVDVKKLKNGDYVSLTDFEMPDIIKCAKILRSLSPKKKDQSISIINEDF